MKTIFTLAALAAGIVFLPANVQAGHHGHRGHHGHGHRGHHGHGHHGGWGHGHGHHHHHHHGHWGHYRRYPTYRVQPYPYNSGISIGTPNVWFQSGW